MAGKSPRPKAKKKPAKKLVGRDLNVCLTGPLSWFGKLLVPALCSHPEIQRVVLLDIHDPGINHPKAVYYTIDLTNPSADRLMADIFAHEKINALAHMAFQSGPSRDQQYAHELMVIGTMQALNACAESSVKRICCLSTTLVYGARPSNPNYLSEQSPLRASRDYPYLKDRVEAEQLLARYAKKHAEACVSVLRPCTVTGPHSGDYMNRYLTRGVVPTILGYDPLFQFVHEKDAVNAYLRVLTSGEKGAFNVCGKGVLPLSSAISLLGNMNWPVLESPARTVSSYLYHAGLLNLPEQHLDHMKYLLVADGARIEKKLGFTARLNSREALSGVPGY